MTVTLPSVYAIPNFEAVLHQSPYSLPHSAKQIHVKFKINMFEAVVEQSFEIPPEGLKKRTCPATRGHLVTLLVTRLEALY